MVTSVVIPTGTRARRRWWATLPTPVAGISLTTPTTGAGRTNRHTSPRWAMFEFVAADVKGDLLRSLLGGFSWSYWKTGTWINKTAIGPLLWALKSCNARNIATQTRFQNSLKVRGHHLSVRYSFLVLGQEIFTVTSPEIMEDIKIMSALGTLFVHQGQNSRCQKIRET